MSTTMITKDELLQHWLGHRALTRKTIEKFPEKELFEFSIGGMRTFSALAGELLALTGALKQVVTDAEMPYNSVNLANKADILKQWDEETLHISACFNELTEDRLHQKVSLFGQYENIVINHILYFIDNEIHHRAQGFVYLRALSIEPPFFWERI